MTNNNFKPINQNQPTQIVQEVETTWEQQVEAQEREVFEQIEIEKRTDEEGFYVAEAVENANSENNLACQPSRLEENQKHFLFKIDLDNYYLGDTQTSWLFRNVVREHDFEKVEEAQDLLQELEAGNISVFSYYWLGMETSQAKKVKSRLIKKLRDCTNHYQNGGEVLAYFGDER